MTEEEWYDHTIVRRIKDQKKIVNGPQFQFDKVCIGQVKQALEKINRRKKDGFDRIPGNILCIASKELSPSLTKLFNACIEQNYWPLDWKCGEWVPVYKKDDPREMINYRPVTVLSSVGKVFEKLLGEQITAFMEPRLNDNLTAYRKRNSCETTLVRLVEDWKHMLDNGEVIGMLSTDLSKAFDSLNPPLMLAKLRAYDFSEQSIQMMSSYFSCRKNRVRMGSSIVSEWRQAVRGCPQGSNLGPLMWNIYQNDLVSRILKCRLSMFADDHLMYCSGQKMGEIADVINDEGKRISQWYRDNQLKGNQDKFQAMGLGNKTKDTEMNLDIMNNNIESKSAIRILGVTIDKELNFTQHISDICSKAARKVGVLYRFKNMITTKAKLALYKSFILPNLTYCHMVWQFCRASDARKIERIQERALRAVYSSKNLEYSDLLKEAGLPTLRERRLKDLAIFMYKVKNELAPSYIKDLFKLNNKNYSLRNADDFNIHRFNTVKTGKHSIRYMGPFLWSKLDKAIKEVPSLNLFKSKIDQVNIEELLNDNCRRGCLLCNS